MIGKRLLPLALIMVIAPARASVVITEVAPWSSGNSVVAADWFELTNTGPGAVSLVGWKMDDNSNQFSMAVNIRGVTSILPGQSVIFFEGDAAGTTDAAITARFNSVWGTSLVFGTSIGAYGGSGVGLSTSGDAVNVYDAGGGLQANVSFGSSPGASPFATFDNSAGLNNALISTLSAVGTNGAYQVVDSSGNVQIGSPAVVPLPASGLLLLGGGSLLAAVRRRWHADRPNA